MTPRVTLYSTERCSFCRRAGALLRELGVPFREIDVTSDAERRRWLVAATGKRTVPQIFFDGRPAGGYQELADLVRRGLLRQWLASPAPEPAPRPPRS